MKSKNMYAFIHFKTLLQTIIMMSIIWREIRDSVFYFLEKNIDYFSDLTLDALISFAELLDELLTKVKNLENEFASTNENSL